MAFGHLAAASTFSAFLRAPVYAFGGVFLVRPKSACRRGVLGVSFPLDPFLETPVSTPILGGF